MLLLPPSTLQVTDVRNVSVVEIKLSKDRVGDVVKEEFVVWSFTWMQSIQNYKDFWMLGNAKTHDTALWVVSVKLLARTKDTISWLIMCVSQRDDLPENHDHKKYPDLGPSLSCWSDTRIFGFSIRTPSHTTLECWKYCCDPTVLGLKSSGGLPAGLVTDQG